jgi:hypothetical protein
MFVVLTVGGMIQGLDMNQASASLGSRIGEHGLFGGLAEWFGGFKARNGAVPFMEVVRGTVPWLAARSVSGVMILIGHIAFFILVVRSVHAWGRQRTEPAMFHERDRAELEELMRRLGDREP